jgi:hypothetical protein
MLALAEALGWPFELKPVRYRDLGRPFELFRGTGLFGLARDSAATLEPPWPDLVIGAGMFWTMYMKTHGLCVPTVNVDVVEPVEDRSIVSTITYELFAWLLVRPWYQ